MKFNYRLLSFLISFAVVALLIFLHRHFGILPFQWTMSQPFSDIKGVLGASDCQSAGFDPYHVTSFDPWGRTFNYPKIWLSIFGFLHLTIGSGNLLGIIFILLFIASTILLFKINNVYQLVIVLILIFSPSNLLLFERGNLDVIIYLLILLGVFYLRKIKSINPIIKIHLTYLIILFTVFLKIYPVILLPLLIFENISLRNFIFIVVYSIILMFAYFYTIYSDLVFIFANTPRPGFIAYGKNILLQHYLNEKMVFIVSGILIALTVAVAIFICERYKSYLKEIIPITASVKENIFLFLCGAFIYAGTFIHGNNYDYKLVFLMLTIPYIIDIWNQTKHKILPAAAYCVMFVVLYGSFIAEIFYFKYWNALKVLSTWGELFLIFILLFYFLKNRKQIISIQ